IEAAANGANRSLDLALVVEQPLLIRSIVGPLYALLMPIPVWAGFELGSVYQIGKSLGALFCYFLVPAVAARIWGMKKNGSSRSASVIFLLMVFMIFLITIGLTSLESR